MTQITIVDSITMKAISNNRIKGIITGVTKGLIITIDMIISKIKLKIRNMGASSKYNKKHRKGVLTLGRVIRKKNFFQ